MKKILGGLILFFTSMASIGLAEPVPNFIFTSIEGGEIELDSFRGKALLITNTASKCGFTGQYKDLQTLYEKYKDSGLVVLGIPSPDFRQEYKDNDNIKNFCEVNFGITFPMAAATHVLGKRAHPFFQWLADKHNFKPRWNFNKILIGKSGELVVTFGTAVSPSSNKVENAIVTALKK